MEEWETDHIDRNLHHLIRLTTCSPSLLANLLAERILGHGDLDMLRTPGMSEFKQAFLLYSIVKTRRGGYWLMMQALQQDSQSGAYEILQEGKMSKNIQEGGDPHPDPHPSNKLGSSIATQMSSLLFVSPLPAIVHFIDDDNGRGTRSNNILVLQTPSQELTLKRIRDTGGLEYLKVHELTKGGPIRAKLNGLEEGMALVILCDKSIEVVLQTVRETCKKVVLVTEDSETEVENVLGNFPNPKPKVTSEEICWGDLAPVTKNMILEHHVNFQNAQILLKDVPSNILQLEHLKGKFLIELISGKSPELVKNSVPLPPPFYVPRKVSIARRISPKIFADPGPDIFVISGIELHQLTNFSLDCDESSNQLHQLTVQLILLQFEGDFGKICDLSRTPVHLLSYEDGGQFRWVKSVRSVARIQRYVLEEMEEEVLDEEEFIIGREIMIPFLDETPVCIADSPGMGKSIWLAKIADAIMSRRRDNNGTSVVRFLVLQELVRELEGQGQELNVDSVIQAIAAPASEYELGREVVVNCLKSESVRCHLFLDGFDEVLEPQLETAKQILELVKKGLRNTQLYVTTRLHRRQELEQVLGVLGFTLVPFAEQDQESFLLRFWQASGATLNSNLEEFAKLSLQNLKKNESERERERDIAGIPLQCRLLGEVLSHQATEYSRTGFLHAATPPSTLSSVFQMYESFMNMGFDRAGLIFPELKYAVIYSHLRLAIDLLAPSLAMDFDEASFWTETCPCYLPSEYSSLQYLPGIVERRRSSSSTGGGGGLTGTDHLDPHRFVHRTFAEYLVALFISQYIGIVHPWPPRLDPIPDHALKLLLDVVLKTFWPAKSWEYLLGMGGRPGSLFKSFHAKVDCNRFQNPVVVYFLNAILTSRRSIHAEDPLLGANLHDYHSPLNHSPVFWGLLAKSCPKFPEMYAASVDADAEAVALLLQWLMERAGEHAGHDFWAELNWSDLFLLAAQKGGRGVMVAMAKFLEFRMTKTRKAVLLLFQLEYPRVRDYQLHCHPFELTPLHVAVRRGDFHVTMTLLNHGGYRGRLEDDAKAEQEAVVVVGLLHFLVADTLGEPRHWVTSAKIQILKVLVGATGFANHLREEKLNGRTPLLNLNVHLALIHSLIELGADVNATSDAGDSLLHTVLQYDRRSSAGAVSPSQYHHLLETLLSGGKFRLFAKANQKSRTALHDAVQKLEMSLDSIQIFLGNGVDINSVGPMGIPPPLPPPPSPDPPNRVDDDIIALVAPSSLIGTSILHCAILGGRSGDFIRQLHALGADLTQTTMKDENALHLAAKRGNVGAAEYLLSTTSSGTSSSLLLNAVDSNGNTPLHLAVAENSADNVTISKMLIAAAGADLQGLNKDGDTPFIHGMKGKRGLDLDIIQRMEQQGGFQICPQVASQALLHLLLNENLLNKYSWEEKEEVDRLIPAAEYLIRNRGAHLRWKEDRRNPWLEEEVTSQMDRIRKRTVVTDPLLEKLLDLRALWRDDVTAIRENGNSKYSKVEQLYALVESAPGSFERTILALVACRQYSPFGILRACFRTLWTEYGLPPREQEEVDVDTREGKQEGGAGGRGVGGEAVDTTTLSDSEFFFDYSDDCESD